MNLITFAYVMAGIRTAIGLSPIVAIGPVSKLFGFPGEQMNPTARLMARLFGIRNVALAALLVGAARGQALLPFVFLLNAATDLSDVFVIAVPLARRQGLGRAAGSSLVLALGATAAFLFGWSQAGGAVASRQPPPRAAGSAQVIPWESGEPLLLGRRRAPLSIKVSPRTGSSTLLMGSEDITAGDGIPVHQHQNEDEILFIHAGHGIATVGDHEQPVDRGATIYVPRGTWHGVRNEATALTPIQLLWIFSSPGMDDYFRAISTPPGVEPRARTAEETEDEERKHGIRYEP